MKIELIEASKADKMILKNMIELYNYDLSEYENRDLNEHGLYDYSYLDNYWTEKDRYPFIIRVDDKLAGFVLVNKHSVVTSSPTDYAIAEFFVLKKYRKRGIGKIVAFEVFNKFQGNWEVKQLRLHKVSHIFWNNVINQYTLGNFIELENGNEVWDGPIHRFTNKLKKEDTEIKEAMDVLYNISGDKELIQLAEMRDKAIRDEKSRLQGARDEGIKQGAKDALAKSTIKLLRKKFKDIPDNIIESILNLSLEKIEEINEDLFDIESLEELKKYL